MTDSDSIICSLPIRLLVGLANACPFTTKFMFAATSFERFLYAAVIVRSIHKHLRNDVLVGDVINEWHQHKLLIIQCFY